MFIDPKHYFATGSVRRSGRQLNFATRHSLRSFERSQRIVAVRSINISPLAG